VWKYYIAREPAAPEGTIQYRSRSQPAPLTARTYFNRDIETIVFIEKYLVAKFYIE